jgi:hypothetical protein
MAEDDGWDDDEDDCASDCVRALRNCCSSLDEMHKVLNLSGIEVFRFGRLI